MTTEAPARPPETGPAPAPLDRLRESLRSHTQRAASVAARLTDGRRGLLAATILNVLISIPLLFNTVEGADLTAFTSNFRAHSEWGFPLFFNWKFGADFLVLGTAAQGIAGLLQHVGLSGARSLAIGWKMFPALSSILSAYLLGAIARQLGYRHPRRVTIVMLLNPTMMWVASAYGEEEILAAAAFLGAVYFCLRRRFLLAGLATAVGIGFEYWPIAAAVFVLLFAVGVRSEARKVLLRYAGALFGGLLVVFAQFFIDPSLISGLSKTVTPVSSVGGAAVGPIYPLSIWIFGLKTWAYGHWLFVFAAAVLLTVGLGARWVVRSSDDFDVTKAALTTTAVVIVLAVLLDPRSLAQFSVLLVLSIVLLILTVRASLVLVVVPVLATLTFVTFVSLQGSWTDISGVDALKAWSPGASQELTSVAMRLCVIGSVLVCGYLLCRHTLLGDIQRSDDRWVRIEVGVGTALCVVIAALCAQPSLWSGTFAGSSGGVTALPEVASLNTKAADIYVSPGGGLLAGFPDNLASLASSMRVRPTEVMAIGESRLPLENDYGVIAPHVVAASTGSCKATARFSRSSVVPGDQNEDWLDVWFRKTAASQSGATVISVGSDSIRPGAYEIRSPDWGVRPYLVAAKSARRVHTITLTGPCAVLQSATASRISTLPASGRGSVVLSGTAVPVRFSLQPDGDGVAFGFAQTSLSAATSLGTAVRGAPELGVSGLSLVWPNEAGWTSPAWLDVCGFFLFLLLCAGIGLGCWRLAFRISEQDHSGETA